MTASGFFSFLHVEKPPRVVLYPTGAGDEKVPDLAGITYEGGAECLPDGKGIILGRMPLDVAGLIEVGNILTTPDGKSFALGYSRMLSDLYLLRDLK